MADRLAAAGAVVVGAWSGGGGIGWWDDEATILAGVPDGVHLEDVELEDATVERLRATARPEAIAPLGAGGVFAHRWFELAANDWDELLELSTGAWPVFEATYGATIEGFFRSEDVAPPDARVLLLTRYPSLAAWEESRGAVRDPNSEAAEAGQRFLRRRELTRRTVVRTGTLL